MSISEHLVLNAGETLRFDSSRETGFMGETDINSYSIIDAAGSIVGRVEHTEHMNVKGFKVTHSVIQTDLNGNTVHSKNW